VSISKHRKSGVETALIIPKSQRHSVKANPKLDHQQRRRQQLVGAAAAPQIADPGGV
jgi:hypothetical protein